LNRQALILTDCPVGDGEVVGADEAAGADVCVLCELDAVPELPAPLEVLVEGLAVVCGLID